MNDFITDIFETWDHYTISVGWVGGKIRVRKVGPEGELAGNLELSTDEARHLLTTQPTAPRVAWLAGDDLLLAPPEVARVAEAMTSTLASLDNSEQ